MTAPDAKSASSRFGSASKWRGIVAGCFLLLIGVTVTGLPMVAASATQPQKAAFQSDPQRHGGPDEFGYVFDDEQELGGPVFDWLTATNRIADGAWQATRTVSSTTTLDDGVVTTTLPFAFTFYGITYNELHISTNGNAHFGPPNDWFPEQSATCVPSNSQYVPQGMIAPLWYDFFVPDIASGLGGVYTGVVGTSPNRTYIVEWRHVYRYIDPNSYATMEMLLYENGAIYFQYQQLVGTNVGGSEGVVGIQNASGTIGLPYSCYVGALVPGRAIQYVAPVGGTPSPTATGTPPTATSTRTSTQSPTPTPTAIQDCWAAWSVVTSPNPGSRGYGFRAIAVVSANDMWAVGQSYVVSGGVTLAEHWDGNIWRVVPSPNQSARDNQLWSVSAVSSNDVWAVGNYTDELFGRDYTLIEHWNGTSWSIVPSPNPGSDRTWLRNVAAVSANDVWAVGYYASNKYGPNQSLILHWNGIVWNVALSSYLMPYSNILSDVAAISANDVWAVGIWQKAVGLYQTLAVHWDGHTWTVIPSPSPGLYVNDFSGVDAISTNDVWAVGSYYDYDGAPWRPLIQHWNGIVWTIILNPSPELEYHTFLTVKAVSTNDVWATGYKLDGIGGPAQTLAKHWDGNSWSIVPSPNLEGNNFLGGLAAVSANDVWAVGSSGGIATNIATLVERYRGGFPDVQPTDYFYDAARYLYCVNAISGYADGMFHPSNLTTRGQLAKIVVLAEGWPIYTPPSRTFRDVPTTDAFYPYIETAYHHNIISGYTCGTNCLEFRPGNNITRGQLCKIIVLAEGWTTYTPPIPTFRDVSTTQTFYPYIETAYNHTIISGYNCGSDCLEFRPGNNATRGQICKIVYNAVIQP